MDHSAPPGFPTGLDSFKQAFTIEDTVAEGDKVVARLTFRGTHRGELMGIPPTGKQVTITGIAIDRLKDGKVVEHWVNRDDLSMLQQMDALPMPGQVA